MANTEALMKPKLASNVIGECPPGVKLICHTAKPGKHVGPKDKEKHRKYNRPNTTNIPSKLLT